MPTYDYICPECGHDEEIFHYMSDDTERFCPECDVAMEKQFGTGYVMFDTQKPSVEKQIKEREERAQAKRGTPTQATHSGSGSGQGRALGGQHMEVDKGEMIKALAKDDASVKLAQKALKKAANKKK